MGHWSPGRPSPKKSGGSIPESTTTSKSPEAGFGDENKWRLDCLARILYMRMKMSFTIKVYIYIYIYHWKCRYATKKNRTLSNSSAFGLPSAEKLELVLPTSLSESKLSQEVFSSFEIQMDRPPVSIHTHHLGLPPATAIHRLLELPIQMSSSRSKRITNKLSLIAYRA